MNDADRLKHLYAISLALHQNGGSLHRLLQNLLARTGEALGVQHGCLITFHDHIHIDRAYVLGVRHNDVDYAAIWSDLFRRGLVGFAYYAERAVVVRNIETDPRWHPLPDDVDFLLKSGSAVAVPILREGRITGVMMLMHAQRDHFNAGRIALLNEIIEMAGQAVANAAELQAARTGDTRYQSLFEHAVVPIILTDKRGTILDVNHLTCDWLDYERAALLRAPIQKLHPEIKTLETYGIDKLRTGDETFFRTTIHNAQGQPVTTLVRARGLRVNGQEIIEWVEQDMSAQVELEQLRRDLTAMVYHDLRGPLHNILAVVFKLGEVLRNHDNPAVLKLLQMGLRSSRQMQRLIDSLLDLQRMEEGNNLLNRQPVEPRVLLTDAIQLVQQLAAENEQRIHTDYSGDLPLLRLDGDMIMRVVVNLLENAIKYTPQGGQITLSARMEEKHLRVAVRDSGPGIPAEMRQRIFDKFSRVQYENAPRGVGLGLAFCRLAIDAHQGRIWVESDEGRGSDFIFTIPLTDEDMAADASWRKRMDENISQVTRAGA